MAGDWIPWVKGLPNKREVVMMADRLGLDRRIVACACMEAWCWADSETVDGNAPSVTFALLDALTGVPGFGQAMVDVDWLIADKTGIRFPNWDRYNTASAKKRLRCRTRKRRYDRKNG